jgi:hypothetical protein
VKNRVGNVMSGKGMIRGLGNYLLAETRNRKENRRRSVCVLMEDVQYRVSHS